jgi:hypothetical protein
VSQQAFVELEAQRRALVGHNKRIVDVTESRVIGGSTGSTALLDALVEYDHAIVRSTFKLERASKTDPWQLVSYKVVMPPPRADVEKPHGDGGVDGGAEPVGDGGVRDGGVRDAGPR